MSESGRTFDATLWLGIMVLVWLTLAVLWWRSKRWPLVNKLKLLCLIGVMQVTVGLLTLNDQWREARGETSIREWLRPELQPRRRSHQSHLGSMQPIPDASVPRSAQSNDSGERANQTAQSKGPVAPGRSKSSGGAE